jgi:hypothetical protein
MKTLAVPAFLLLLAVTGCDKIEHQYDCHSICQKYADCADSSYDVDSCTDSCSDEADSNEDFADRADSCQACVDDRACSETFPCIDDCIGIVP